MVFHLPKHYLDFVLTNLYFVEYYLDGELGKLHVHFTVTVILESSISILERDKFHNNSYESCPLFFIGSSALLKMAKSSFSWGETLF